jgi:hypothetical protein
MALSLLTGITHMRRRLFIGHKEQAMGTKDSTNNLQREMTEPTMPLCDTPSVTVVAIVFKQ